MGITKILQRSEAFKRSWRKNMPENLWGQERLLLQKLLWCLRAIKLPFFGWAYARQWGCEFIKSKQWKSGWMKHGAKLNSRYNEWLFVWGAFFLLFAFQYINHKGRSIRLFTFKSSLLGHVNIALASGVFFFSLLGGEDFLAFFPEDTCTQNATVVAKLCSNQEDVVMTEEMRGT